MYRPVSKSEICLASAGGLDNRAVGDTAQCQHDRAVFQVAKFIREKTIAGVDFRTYRLVVRRQALDRIRNAAVDKSQIIIGRHGLRVAAEAEFMQRFVQQYAGMVAGKRPPRAVCAVHSRRKANDKETRVRSAKRGYRAAVVVRVLRLDPVQKTGQPRTTAAVPVENVSHACAG
jgi:hypothetical protein